MSRNAYVGAVIALFALTASGTAVAEVYVTSPSTGRILVLDGSGSVTRVIGAAGGLGEPFSIAMDSGRNLLVTDYAQGRVLQFNPDGTNASIRAANIPKPDGLSVGASGELYLVSRDNRTLTTRTRLISDSTTDENVAPPLNKVWFIPAGGALPMEIGSVGESFRLAQTRPVLSGPHAGDILVLSTRPGLAARFIQTGPTTFERSSDFISYVPGEPTSMAYSRTGELLISTSDGRILRYSDTGTRLQPDFASGLPVGPTTLTIGMDGVVHLTPVGSTSIIRFDPYASRLPDLSGATVPLAAALTTGCSPTPVGQNVAVSLAAGVGLIFDNVVAAGQTCLQTTALPAGVTTTPHNNTIPAFARKLHEDPGFVVYDITTTARFTDTLVADFFAPNPEARVMAAHGTGAVMSDGTVLVTPTDPRTRQGSLSGFVIYLDTRSPATVAVAQLADLQSALNGYAQLIDPIVFAQLQTQLTQIAAAVGNGGVDADRALAISLLRDFKAFTRLNSGEGIANAPGPDGGGNAAGGLISLADTLVFHLAL